MLYNEHLREENAKKRQKEAERLKHEAHKRKLEEMKAEEKNLHETLKKLKTTHAGKGSNGQSITMDIT